MDTIVYLDSVANQKHVAQEAADCGLQRFVADFYTEYRSIRGEVLSAETRLSDHLNGSAPTVDIRPFDVTQMRTGTHIDLAGSAGHITKSRLMFVVPLQEPLRPMPDVTRRANVPRRCWAGVGPYQIVGTIAADSGRDLATALRMNEKQFVLITDATITHPDGGVRDCSSVLVNRLHLDVLAVRPSAASAAQTMRFVSPAVS